MIESQKMAVEKAARAVKEAKLAYQFTPNSYTYSSLQAMLATYHQALTVLDDWGCPR